jgi:hypothetical protein
MRKYTLAAPSPAMVIASVALFVALGGTGYAASQLAHSPAASVAKKKKKKAVSETAADKALFNKLIPSAHVAFAAAAGSATFATNAAHATSADSATTATSATSATSAATATNSNQLQGFTANQLVRATAASAGVAGDPCTGPAALSGFESTTFTNAVTSSVTAPVAGILVVLGHTASEFDSSSPVGSSLRLLGRLAVDGTQAGPESETSLSETAATCKEGRTMSLSFAVPVTAGSHTVAVQVAKSASTGGTGKAYVGNASVTTMFVPFGSSGTQGAIASRIGPGVETRGNR